MFVLLERRISEDGDAGAAERLIPIVRICSNVLLQCIIVTFNSNDDACDGGGDEYDIDDDHDDDDV